MAETTKVESSKEYTAKDFIKDYEELCKKTGFQIVAQPVWVATNHGSFEMTVQAQVGELPKK